jgi:hypothetical protein
MTGFSAVDAPDPVKVYNKRTTWSSREEIGICTRIALQNAGTGGPVQPVLDSDGWITGMNNLILTIEGWKTPAPNQVHLIQPSRELQETRLMLAALVIQMGGAVMIQPHELTDARFSTFHSERMLDPLVYRLRVEDK